MLQKIRGRFSSVPVQASAASEAEAQGGPLQVMISGAPAAGKGTQCAMIVQKYGLVHISVGDLLRAEVAAETPAGKKAKAYMDAGDLVPNDVVVEMVKVSMCKKLQWSRSNVLLWERAALMMTADAVQCITLLSYTFLFLCAHYFDLRLISMK